MRGVSEMKMNRRIWLASVVFLSIMILAGQLLAGVGFAADSANSGPSIAIIQMWTDENTAWATKDIESRLEKFIQDDPFIRNRIAVYHIDTLEQMTRVYGDIIIYISHGGKNGLMTGDHMTTWEEMAKVVMDSDASIHLFAACKSKEIIKYGEEESEKQLYTVPSVRAAEVTNVEIATIVMLADGVSTDVAEEYRNTELMKAKQLIESGKSAHPLPFDEIILAEIDQIETNHDLIFDNVSENPSDNDVRCREFHFDTWWDIDDYNLIPQQIRSLLEEYYPTGTASSLSVTCRDNYYTREIYEADPEPVPDWYPDMTEMDVFTGCKYSGEFTLAAAIDFTVKLTARGDTENGVDSIILEHVNDGGVYVIHEKEAGIWQSPIVGRNRTRTGGTWIDSGATVRFNQQWETPNSEEWSYRKIHTIHGSQGAGANYQVRFVVHSDYGDDSGEHVYCDGNCRQDFADIRFIAMDRENLNHWIESIDYSTNQAVFWVRIEDDLDSDQQIYIYYGNDQASSESNGEATFLFFDDFEDQDFNEWDTTDAGSWTTVSNVVKRGSYAAYCAGGAPQRTLQALLNDVPHGVMLHVWARAASTSTYAGWPCWGRGTTNGGTKGFYSLSLYSSRIRYYQGSYTGWPQNYGYSANTWYELELGLNPNTDKQRAWKDGLYMGEIGLKATDGSSTYESLERLLLTAGSHSGKNIWADDYYIRKWIESEPSHGAWGEEQSARLKSSGEYLYISSIPEGSGWHGPKFTKNLPTYFGFDQLDIFSAELSLVHDGDGSKMSKTSVNLYDQNDVRVMSLQVIDDTNAQSQKFRSVVNGRYIWGDNEAIHETGYISGNVTGTVSIRYDPLRGIIAKAFDLQETVLYSPTGFDSGISIKYITIESLRFGNAPEHDEQISDIKVNFAASDYTVFSFECNTMDGFHKDLDFGYGASSDGEFVVPYGADYMTPSSIPDSPAEWHGPNFVHVLDKPFRLYQLSEFSVIGQLIQSSSTMGQTYVALFDENKQIVLLIHWGDSWADSKKSYFNVYFYPQNGGSHSQSSGYIDNSGFTKTGKLYWVEDFGSDGAICSSIDGSGSSYPIGNCDNAFRVIKYAVLLGYRYSNYNLVDMRIHDINLVVDLNRDIPAGEPEPVEYDGTAPGSANQDEQSDADLQIEDAHNQLVRVYWAPGWPILNFVILNLLDTSEKMMHFSINLLNALTVHTLFVFEFIMSLINAGVEQVSYIFNLVEELWDEVVEIILIPNLFSFALASWILFDTLKFMIVTPAAGAIAAALCAACALTATFIAVAFLLTASAIEMFGYNAAGTIWLVVFLVSGWKLLMALISRFDPNGAITKVVQVANFIEKLFGPFYGIPVPMVTFSWGTMGFLLGTFALSIIMMYYYYTLV
jgi:hypothetical protein